MPTRVNEVRSNIDSKIDALTNLVKGMMAGQTQQVKTCGICLNMGHPTNMCLTLQEEHMEQSNAIGGFPRQQQRHYDPYSNTYNPVWRGHPNFSYK